MAYTREEVLALLGDEAQSVPGAILVYRDRHIEVALTGLDGAFAVTPEGAQILDALTPITDPMTDPAPKARRTRAAKVRQDAVPDTQSEIPFDLAEPIPADDPPGG